MSGGGEDRERALTLDQLVERAREHTRWLYDGVETPHRSCGISLAETFGQPTKPFQSLRRGGITGCGECGAIKAGELILGAILGDPDPTGGTTPELRAAAVRYRELWQERVDLGGSDSIICNTLTAPFEDFRGPERHAFCTALAASASECVAQTLIEVAPERRAAWSAALESAAHPEDQGHNVK